MKKNILSCFVLSTIVIALFGQSQEPYKKAGIYHIRGTDEYAAAISSKTFDFYQEEQIKDEWCWAASTQMVLSYQGIPITQQDIVKKVFGPLINKGASCDEMVQAANGWIYNGDTVRAWSVPISITDMIDALAHKYPLIIGLHNVDKYGQMLQNGHALVLTAVYYRYDADNQEVPYKVRLRDPWPWNPHIYEISWKDFTNRITCIIHVTY